MSDLGLLCFYLGVEVHRDASGITLRQTLRQAHPRARWHGWLQPSIHPDGRAQADEVDSTHYRRLGSSLWYLVHTRPDLASTVRFVSRFMERPTVELLQAVKRVLRYVAGTLC